MQEKHMFVFFIVPLKNVPYHAQRDWDIFLSI